MSEGARRERKITFQQCPQNQKEKTFHPINHLLSPSLSFSPLTSTDSRAHGTAIFVLAFGFPSSSNSCTVCAVWLDVFACILNAITFFFSQRSGKITLLMFFVVLFSFSSIAFDFPTEFSALFDSCGVIINLNNEIPKWNPIYNSSEHDVQTNRGLCICFLCNFI